MLSGVAGGNITPSRFLIRGASTQINGSADNVWLQASSATAAPLAGISQPGTRNTPYSTLDDGYCAISGENLHVYIAGRDKEAFLELGGTVTPGDLLTADSSGRGITATSGQQVGARAVQAGVLGNIVQVEPLWGDMT